MRLLRNKQVTSSSGHKTLVKLLVEHKLFRFSISEDDLFKRWYIGLIGHKAFTLTYRKDLKRYIKHTEWCMSYPWYPNYKIEDVAL